MPTVKYLSLLILLNCYKKIYIFCTKYKNEWKEHKFWRQIKTSDFYKNNKVAKIDDIDVNKILVPKKKAI